MDNFQDYQIYVSQKSVLEAVEGLKKSIEASGLIIFSHIDHEKEALQSNLSLPEEQLLIFGDPKVGTFLMQENPLIGIELPLKILVWSFQGETHIAFPNVLLWQKRFALSKQVPTLEKMMQLFNKLAQQNGFIQKGG
ncbi:MAG: DUF302 domain-containing protein [Chlamydiales bacterium]